MNVARAVVLLKLENAREALASVRRVVRETIEGAIREKHGPDWTMENATEETKRAADVAIQKLTTLYEGEWANTVRALELELKRFGRG